MKTAATNSNWAEANQHYLMAAVAQVGLMLERHRAEKENVTEPVQDQAEKIAETLREAAAAMPSPSALETLCAAFHLSDFEKSVLLLCAGVELDSAFAARCATAQNNSLLRSPTFGLALAVFPNAHWSALTPNAPLRRWRLLELANNDSLTTAPLRLDERVLHFLTGVNELDERLRSLVQLTPAPSELPPSQMEIVGRIGKIWAAAREKEFPVIQLGDSDEAGRSALAALACQKLNLRLHTLRHADIPATATERERLSRLWEREAILSHSALLIRADNVDAAECARTLLPFLDQTKALLLVSRREPLPAGGRSILRFDVRTPSPTEQKNLWQKALGDSFHRFNGQIEKVVTQFNLGSGAIQTVAADLRTSVMDGKNLEASLWESCRTQARASLDDLAQRLEPSATWDDLVLPENQRRILNEIAAHLRQRAKVYETWGFAGKGARGLGISALFAGASGTGKTMAAEVLANELHLDLYRIDLSSVVSKYIGETEKNLRRVFDAAEQGGAILLFDEADALFGKRSEVKDSHDRYANIEVSYLLQRMEAYRGLAILTTNLKDALDTAFLRRLRFVVQFPFPDAAHRAEIWRRIFPAKTPVENLDATKLSRLNVAGGNIRNVALNAAFLAAEAGEPVRMNHLARAARSEYAKLEKPLTETEIGGWA
jgi:AAA+ superfamily predicted ATPase